MGWRDDLQEITASRQLEDAKRQWEAKAREGQGWRGELRSLTMTPGMEEAQANWPGRDDLSWRGDLQRITSGMPADPSRGGNAEYSMVSEDPYSVENPSIGTASGHIPTAAEQALAWQSWNANRAGVRRLRSLGEQGYTQLPNRMVGPGGGMTQQELAMYATPRGGRNPAALVPGAEQSIMARYRREQGQLPSINTIASPGVY